MPVKAVGLLSGGLDSTLAARLMLDQGIEVYAVNFTSPFCTCTPKSAGCSAVMTAVKQLGDIPLKQIFLGDEYLEIVKKPRYGYGRGLNPCIDCRIMKLRKAAEYMREIGASFLFTGEVIGQRPMSQTRQAIEIIDRESSLEGLILRPLSAKAFAPTVPERNGWVNRDALMEVSGRSRKPQITLAKQMGIMDYPCSAGGCLLTDPRFASRLKDYFEFTLLHSCADIPLLRIGRHFRFANGDKVIVARNEKEGKQLIRLGKNRATILAPLNFSAPVVALEGKDLPAALQKMSDHTNHEIPHTAMLRVIDMTGEKVVPLRNLIRSWKPADRESLA